MMQDKHKFWNDRKVMMTKGAGSLGGYFVEKLRSRSDSLEILVPRSDNYDLRKNPDIKRTFEDFGADSVIHLAATVDGIGVNRVTVDTSIITPSWDSDQFNQSRQYNVNRFKILRTTGTYPKYTPALINQEDIWNSDSEEKNVPYRFAI